MFRKSYRLCRKYYLHLLRSKGSPHSIALGVGIGIFSGLVVPLGQIFLAIILAFVFKGNKILAIAMTFITNPYTTPIIYPVLCYTGSKIIGGGLSFYQIKSAMEDVLLSFSWGELLVLGHILIISYLIGGAVIGGFLGVISYFVSLKIVIRHRNKRTKRLELRKEELKKMG